MTYSLQDRYSTNCITEAAQLAGLNQGTKATSLTYLINRQTLTQRAKFRKRNLAVRMLFVYPSYSIKLFSLQMPMIVSCLYMSHKNLRSTSRPKGLTTVTTVLTETNEQTCTVSNITQGMFYI